MRVLIDTNVLISAALNANGVPFQAYIKAVSYPNDGLICEQNVEEMKRIFNKKFSERLAALDKFLSTALLTLELVPIRKRQIGVNLHPHGKLGKRGCRDGRRTELSKLWKRIYSNVPYHAAEILQQ